MSRIFYALLTLITLQSCILEWPAPMNSDANQSWEADPHKDAIVGNDINYDDAPYDIAFYTDADGRIKKDFREPPTDSEIKELDVKDAPADTTIDSFLPIQDSTIDLSLWDSTIDVTVDLSLSDTTVVDTTIDAPPHDSAIDAPIDTAIDAPPMDTVGEDLLIGPTDLPPTEATVTIDSVRWPEKGEPCGSSTPPCKDNLSCVDGVCCISSSCPGICRACNVPGNKGSCANVPAGQDPDNECNYVSKSVCPRVSPLPICDFCQNTGANCDGNGACESINEPTGTICVNAECDSSGNSLLLPRICDGHGICKDYPDTTTNNTLNCFPYTCDPIKNECYKNCINPDSNSSECQNVLSMTLSVKCVSCGTTSDTLHRCGVSTTGPSGFYYPKLSPGEECPANQSCGSASIFPTCYLQYCRKGNRGTQTVCCDTNCAGQNERCDYTGFEGKCICDPSISTCWP